MLSIMMFILGVVLLNRGRAHIPFMQIHAEGSAVRTAGIVLMLPLGFSMVVGFFIGMASGGDMQRLFNAVETVAYLELIAIIVAAITAYVILRRNEVPFTTNQVEPAPRRSHPLATPPQVVVEPVREEIFPRIMTVEQAARYLRTSEKRIEEAINNGELAAARGNNGYSIARIVLDEYRDRFQASHS